MLWNKYLEIFSKIFECLVLKRLLTIFSNYKTSKRYPFCSGLFNLFYLVFADSLMSQWGCRGARTQVSGECCASHCFSSAGNPGMTRPTCSWRSGWTSGRGTQWSRRTRSETGTVSYPAQIPQLTIAWIFSPLFTAMIADSYWSSSAAFWVSRD